MKFAGPASKKITIDSEILNEINTYSINIMRSTTINE